MPSQPIFDENGNMTYQPNIWAPENWQTANGGMSQTMPVPMQGGQPIYGSVGGNPINVPGNQPTAPQNWWSQNSPGGAQQGAQGAPGGLNGPTVTPEAIMAYGQSRGVNLSPQEAQYWVDKWPELYARGQEIGQPDYAMGRLQLADQWTPPSQRAAAPAGYGGTVGGLGGGMSPTDVMAQDPGYQFRLGEGLNAIQRGAAARGTLLTGGLQKGLQRYAQDYASGEYGNIFGRNLDLARLGQFGAQGTAQGYSNAGQAAGIYGQGMAGALQNQGNVQGAGTVGAGNAWSGTLGQLGNLAAIYAMRRGRGY